jgi:hypothetical protein
MLSFAGEGGRNAGTFCNGPVTCCTDGDEAARYGIGGTGGSTCSGLPPARKNWLLPERALTADKGGEGEFRALLGTSSCTPFA